MRFFESLGQNGMTLTGVTIGIAVSAIGWVATVSYLSYHLSVSTNFEVVSTRDEIALLLQRYISSPAAMSQTLSFSSDPNIKACVLSNMHGSNYCLHAVTSPLSIYDPSGRRFSGPGAVGASPADPQLVDLKGAPCTAGSPNCLIQISTTFTPSCHTEFLVTNPTNPPSCPVAEFVQITYVINALPDPKTHKVYFPTKTGAIYINLEDLNLYGYTL